MQAISILNRTGLSGKFRVSLTGTTSNRSFIESLSVVDYTKRVN